ncbi:hypothetical protein STEG23_014205 [Scotinomys teguina]
MAENIALQEFKSMVNEFLQDIYDLPGTYMMYIVAFSIIIHIALKNWFNKNKKDESLLGLIQALQDSNENLSKKILSLESADLLQELKSINNKCTIRFDSIDSKYEYLMGKTITLQGNVAAIQILCKEERLSLTGQIFDLQTVVSCYVGVGI